MLDDLRAETEKLGSLSEMLVGHDQGSFLPLLVAALGVRSAVEIGTFTGYSAICIARGLGPEGRLLCIDVNADWTAIGRRYWKRAGVEGKIELSLRAGRRKPRRCRQSPRLTLPSSTRTSLATISVTN